MTVERDITEFESTTDPVVDLDPETYPTAADVPGSVVDEAPPEPSQEPPGGAGPEAFPGVADIDPEEPLPEQAPGDDRPAVDEINDGAVDKDLLRGGSGEQGEPSHPETDDNLLRGGSGWPDPSAER